MIPARRGLVAAFKQKSPLGSGKRKQWLRFAGGEVDLEDGEILHMVPIEAWDEGDPMYIGKNGKLTRARGFNNFVGVTEEPIIVQIMPANGWRIWRHNGVEPYFEPIGAFGLRSDGIVVALEDQGNGSLDEWNGTDNGSGYGEAYLAHEASGNPPLFWLKEAKEKALARGLKDPASPS